jgi:hypothetical protein
MRFISTTTTSLVVVVVFGGQFQSSCCDAFGGTSTTSTIPMNTPARQSLPVEDYELQHIPGKGLGVITKKDIPIHTVVGNYIGEIITEDVMHRRYDSPQVRHPDDVEWYESRRRRQQTVTGDYLYRITIPVASRMELQHHNSIINRQSISNAMYVDAEDEYESLWTRFLNHDSNPNLVGKSIHESYDGRPRVWFVTRRDVAAGEELCFDYGDEYWLPDDSVV